MNLYFIILIILGVGSLIDIFSESREFKRNIYIFLIGILVAFFGTRGYIGYDWYSYIPSFEKSQNIIELVKNGFIAGGFEKGFQVYCAGIKLFTDNYLIFNFINTLIDFIILYFIFKRYSKYPIFALFIYFGVYGVAFEIDMIRNLKSILLFILSIKYIEDRKIMPFIALNLLGFFFHSSSLIYFPMYFLLKINWNRLFIFVVFILGNIYYLLDKRLIIKNIGSLANMLPGSIGKKVSVYISIVPDYFPLGVTLFYFERIIIFILVFLMLNRLSEKRYGTIFANSLFLSVFIFLFGAEFSVLTLRIGILFVYSYWFILPMLADLEDMLSIKIGVLILALGISYFRLNNQINFIGNRKLYQYENIFLEHKGAEERRKMVVESFKYLNQGHGKELSLLY